MRGRRGLEHARGILFTAQKRPKSQAAHAVGDNVHGLYRLPVAVLQTRQEAAESRSEILDGGRGRQATRVEKQADLAVALEHLIGDAKRAGERGGTALKLVAVDKHHRR